MFYLFGTAFCKRFFRFWIILILPITCLKAGTISGYVCQSDQSPVAFAFIQNTSKNLMSYSDESGYFDLQGKNEPGDSLQISRIGFHTQRIILSNNKSLQFYLIPKNIDLQSVIVEAQYSLQEFHKNEMIKISKSSATNAINPQKIFSSIPGSYIKTYGGSAGISTLSMDGAPTRHTKILISGFDITNAQNGQVDLSQLPENFINTISYDPYSNSAFEPGNSEGSVNISPWKDNNSVYYGFGSYGKEDYGLSLNFDRSRFTANLLAGKSKDDGDYKGYNPVTQKYEKRENNYLNRDYISLKMNSVISSSLFAKLLYLYSNQERGVAGQIWSPTPESYREDYFHLLGTKLSWVTKIGAGFLQATLRNSWDHYYCSATYGFPYDSEHNVNTIRYKVAQNIDITKWLKFSLSLQCSDDDMQSDDAGDHYRTSWISSNTMAFKWKVFKITPEYHYNYSNDLYAENTWNYTFEYAPDLRFFHSVNLNQGFYFHYPTFNDLYWQPGGNPDLKPEETTSISLDFQFSILRKKDLKILLFDKSSDNLIQWLPSQSYWQPENVAKSFRQGFKTIFSFSWWNFSGFLNYTYNYTEDESTKKQLLYSPKHSGALNLDFHYKNCQLHYQIHYTDKRISRYSWPSDITIDPVTEHTIGISYDSKFRFGILSNSILVENLTNESYETIQGYPEPGRVFKYRIQYYINNKGEKK